MIINKVIQGGTALLDLTEDTVNETNLLRNETAHNSEGEPIVGQMSEGGGTGNYNDLTNKPQINGTTLSGNKTGAQLGLVSASEKGSNNGVASLDSTGRVPSTQLPSYVDDVVEYNTASDFPVTGESGKIYIAKDTNRQYRWSGSAYVEISESLALGETAQTAYRGDRGKTAYDHSQIVNGSNPHNTTADNVILASAMTIGGQTITEVESALNALKDQGGGGGTSNYNDLSNKPQINGNSLSGNKTGSQLGLQNIILSSALTIGGQTVTEVEPALRALNNKDGGHTILDSDGVTMPQRAKLKFVGCTVRDDSTNDTTIIEAEGGGGGIIVVVPTVTNTSITYDGTEQSPTITRDTDHTYIQGDYEATNYGTYTFTIGLSGVNDVWSDNTTEPKTYTWSINYDGGTITPVNDIQTWLKCANIDDKAYTTLNEVLADHETIYALINNNNAMDYLVRSTSWVSGITADETAMEYIGHKNYASNTLLDDSTWCTAICNSTYFESVLRTKVPTMTSNTTPGLIYSGYEPTADGHYDPWHAFDGTSQLWVAEDTDGYVGYNFGNPVRIFFITLQNRASDNTAKDFTIEASTNGNDWNTLSSQYTAQNNETIQSFDVNTNNGYKFWRFHVTSSWAYSPGVRELQFYGRSDITENVIDIYSAASDTVYYMDNGSPVTVCTTDTTGHGTVSKSSLPNGTYTLYSTVAKDLSNLSNDYSKSVTVADNTLEIKVMPDNAYFWYGNMCEWNSGGWESTNYTNSEYSTTLSINDYALYCANNMWQSIGMNKKRTFTPNVTRFTAVYKVLPSNGCLGAIFNQTIPFQIQVWDSGIDWESDEFFGRSQSYTTQNTLLSSSATVGNEYFKFKIYNGAYIRVLVIDD